ncbi:MAG TPA: NAD-dependent epimerase/dehydratase family protein [Capsulimonadaceae bacterium]|nr:NAD-dependent epimerase/dehydratase family protein [Capsulimonadaceae bacterium]
MKVLVTGATGFVGSHTVDALLEQDHSVRCLSRKAPTGVRDRPRAEYIAGVDVGDQGTLKPEFFEGVDAIIHLVGIIQERGRNQTFQRIHVQGTRNIVAVAKHARFKGRFIYMSAIGSTANAPSEYSRTKNIAEETVKTSGFPYTILRPSIILGKDGEFVQQMKELVLYGGLPFPIPSPFIPVPGSGMNKFQPIYVNDLMTCLMRCLVGDTAKNQMVEVGGASAVTFNDLIESFERHLETKKPMIHMPIGLLSAIAPLMKILPKPPFSKDQLKNLSRDNVCDIGPMKSIFGIEPLYFEDTMTIVFAAEATSRPRVAGA